MNNNQECQLSRYVEKGVGKIKQKINKILILKWKMDKTRQGVVIYTDGYV